MKQNSKIKILFFTPFAGYTGSEVMLFNMLRAIDLDKFEINLYALNKGELLDKLPSQIRTYYYKGIGGIGRRIQNKIMHLFSGSSRLERSVMQIHNNFKPDIWYLNTILLDGIADIANKHKIKYAVHFHELLRQYNYVSADKMQKMVDGAFYTVGCSDCVCNNLKVLGSPSPLKQYECIDTSAIKIDKEKVNKLRKELNIPDGYSVVTMSGQQTEIKGTDIFIDVAKKLQNKPYYFLWLGALPNTGYGLFLKKFIEYNKLNNIKLVYPPRGDYYNYLDLADIFFLSSREDSFPLVMLEAAYLSKYIISLNSGGVKEFVNNDYGY